jgi:hypothetical protein
MLWGRFMYINILCIIVRIAIYVRAYMLVVGNYYVQLYIYVLCMIKILSTRPLLMRYVTECTIYIGCCNAYILVYYLGLGDIKLNAGGSLIVRMSALGADGGTFFPP